MEEVTTKTRGLHRSNVCEVDVGLMGQQNSDCMRNRSRNSMRAVKLHTGK